MNTRIYILVCCTTVFLLFAVFRPGYSQSTGRNYIIERTFTDADGAACRDRIDYYDGLGRPEQTVFRHLSPDGGDVVQMQEYDSLGRASRSWYFVAFPDNAGRYVSPDIVRSRAREYYADSHPYAAPVYEASPLGRIREEYGAGSDWHRHSRSVRTDYLLNVAGNDTLNCICYAVEDAPQDTVIVLKRMKDYASCQLEVVRTEDEDGNASFAFSDKGGQLLLTRRILRKAAGIVLDTYYVYDGLGNLAAVLPPEASERCRTDATSVWRSDTSGILNGYAFLYRYNSRSLPIAGKLPGCGWRLQVYDQADRAVFTQDGNQRLRGEWTFSIPDALGRECLTGICRNCLDAFADPLASVPVRAEWKPTADTPAGNGSCKGYHLSGVVLESPTVLSVSHYDGYSFLGKNGLPEASDERVAYESAAEEEGFGKQYAASARGLLTGRMTCRLSDTGQEEYDYTVIYYDAHGRAVQTKGNSHLKGGLEKECFAYNFTGQPLRCRLVHSADGQPTQTEDYAYTYDHAGRLLTVTHSLNGNLPVTLADNTYDELGRLSSDSRNGHPSLRTEYAYNIRSWTERITGPLFSQRLYYNGVRDPKWCTPSYSGNISSMEWKVADDKERGYDFRYDGLSRLTDACYVQYGIRTGQYDTRYAYDLNGNITALQRNGKTTEDGYGLTDKLTMTLDGNRLVRVDDASGLSVPDGGFEFRDGARLAKEYLYDYNGNLTTDLNRGIAEITYNVLNLPEKITFADGTSTEYTYSHAGRKLRTVRKTPEHSSVTDYCGNVVYRDGKAALLLVEGGYVSLIDGAYHFYLTDHQGNVRVVADEDGDMEEVNHYYPFGGLFAESGSIQPYKYNGKELDEALQWYDYGARYYDAMVGRWLASDPSAEKYPMHSTYVYCKDNPILRIDLDGRDDYILTSRGNLSRTQMTSSRVDYVYYNNIGNSKRIIIKDKKLLPSMLEAQNQSKNHNSPFGKTGILEDAARLFKFGADNTQVEWKLDVYFNEKESEYVVITDHNQASVENGTWAAKQTKVIGNRVVDIHSHPSLETQGASESDQRIIKASHNAVYFKKDGTLHEYNSTNKNLNSIQINNSQDLEKFIQSKILK